MRMPATVPKIINVPILIKYFSVSRALAGTSQKHSGKRTFHISSTSLSQLSEQL